LQLWADNIEKIESKDSRTWEDITRALNEKQGLQKSVEQCKRKVKHLKNQYKDKKDWNRWQSRGNLQKSPHYDQIDAVLGCQDNRDPKTGPPRTADYGTTRRGPGSRVTAHAC